MQGFSHRWQMHQGQKRQYACRIWMFKIRCGTGQIAQEGQDQVNNELVVQFLQNNQIILLKKIVLFNLINYIC
jgi:hypothetical protein